MNFETIDRCAQEALDRHDRTQERAPKQVEQIQQVVDLEARNSKLVKEINSFRYSLVDIENTASPLRVVLKRDQESERSIVGIIDTLIDKNPDVVNRSRFSIVSTEPDKEQYEAETQVGVVVEATYGHPVYQGGQGDITSGYPFSKEKFYPSLGLRQRWFAQGVNHRLDSLEETFELFKQAAMDPDLNPELAAKLIAQSEEAQAA